jgi:hypothetical protein
MALARLAVVFMLNGLQIWLPAPAFMEGGQTYVPAREVFQRMGWRAQWDRAAQSLTFTSPDAAGGATAIIVRIGSADAQVNGQPQALGAAPLSLKGTTYIPASVLRFVPGATVTWDAGRRVLGVVCPTAGGSEPLRVTPAGLAADGLKLSGRRVIVAGEYAGWRADPYDSMTAQGPPETRSDWVLHGPDGSIYCTAKTPPKADIQLGPLSGIGRRVEVTGTVAIARQGFAYLRPEAIAAVGGASGLTRYLRTDRRSYAGGDDATLSLTVANPTDQPIALQFPSGEQYDFVVRAVDGTELWRWSAGRVFTMAIIDRTLQPGETYEVSEKWKIADAAGRPLPPGLYRVDGELTRDLTCYPQTFQVR